MTDIDTIYNQIVEIESYDYLQKIQRTQQIRQELILILDNKSNFKDSNEFQDYMLILAEYALSLEKSGKYTKAIKYSDRFLDLIEKYKIEYDTQLTEYIFYRSVISIKARCNYYLKNYKITKFLFKKLLDLDPDNDNFKIWIA